MRSAWLYFAVRLSQAVLEFVTVGVKKTKVQNNPAVVLLFFTKCSHVPAGTGTTFVIVTPWFYLNIIVLHIPGSPRLRCYSRCTSVFFRNSASRGIDYIKNGLLVGVNSILLPPRCLEAPGVEFSLG